MSDEHTTIIGKKSPGKKRPWTPEEDLKLVNYINRFGIWNWVYIPKYAGLSRSGKSCRLRWLNYLNPNIRRGNYSQEEDEIIIHMRQFMGAGWAAIAEKFVGRTDNEIKNRWHTHLKKQLSKNLPVEIVESKVDNCKYISHATTSTSNHGLANEEVLVGQKVSNSSHMLDGIDSDMSNSPPVLEATHDIQMIDIEQPSMDPFQTIEQDPLEIFWRKPFLLDYDHLETNYVQYPDQMITVSTQRAYESV